MRVSACKPNSQFRIATTVSAFVACSVCYADTPPKQPDGALETVIVTAQRRVEKLVDVPMSIAAISGESLDSASDRGVIEALTKVAGVTAFEGFQTGGSLISVRGVAASGNLIGGSSPIGYYVDYAPFGFVRTAGAPDLSPFDLDRIEVLRGPQGTLYGASSLNGVVRILSHEANLSQFEVKTRAIANTVEDGGSGYRVDGAMNVPLISDVLAARVVAGHQEVPGWIDKPNESDANHGDVTNARLRIGWQPTAKLKFDLIGSLSRSNFNSKVGSLDDETSLTTIKEPIDTDTAMYGMKVEYDFGPVVVSSATSYLDYKLDSLFDTNPLASGSNVLTTNLRTHTFSEEINITSTGDGPLRWSLGSLYRDGTDQYYAIRRNAAGQPTGGYVAPNHVFDSSESISVFGELTYAFADGLVELTGGLRYFQDTVRMDEQSRLSGDPALAPPGSPQAVPYFHEETDFDKVTPRVVLSLHPRERMTIYASYAEGFRSGFEQLPAVLIQAPTFQPVKPDMLKNYEIGAKADVFDGRLSFDTAVYYVEWPDVQASVNVSVGTGRFPGFVNLVSASGFGFDGAATFRATDRLSFSGSFSVSELEVDEDVFNAPAPGQPPTVAFAEGIRLPNSPKYTAGANIDYSFPIGSGGLEGDVGVAGSYISSRDTYTSTGAGAFTIRESTDVKNVAARIAIGRDRWRASLFADNLLDKRGYLTPPLLPFNPFLEYNTRMRPRTYGVQVDYSF
jgi:outer membrane receptor protein involved in Fe transport